MLHRTHPPHRPSIQHRCLVLNDSLVAATPSGPLETSEMSCARKAAGQCTSNHPNHATCRSVSFRSCSYSITNGDDARLLYPLPHLTHNHYNSRVGLYRLPHPLTNHFNLVSSNVSLPDTTLSPSLPPTESTLCPSPAAWSTPSPCPPTASCGAGAQTNSSN